MISGTERPFSRYNKIARRTPASKVGTPQPTSYPTQANGSYKPFSSPELDGMKHTRRGEFGRDRTRPIRNRPVVPGVPEAPEEAIMSAQPAGEMQPITQVQETVPQDNIVRTGLENTIGGGMTNETAPEWGTEEYQQDMYNLAREQISGQTAADVEYARTELGGRGFRAGESGIANKALMNIRRKGSETLGQESRKMAMQGMGAKYGQQQDLMKMIMNKYGIDTAAQQNRFNPYYDVERQYAGIA